jgi:hypothetical protein
MNIQVRKIGGIWHGTIEGRPEVDERGLTENIARRKVETIAANPELARLERADAHAVRKPQPRRR